MGETADEIRSEIERTRERLGQDLTALESRVKEETDWRVQVARRPWVFVGAAFGVSLAVGLMIGHGVKVANDESS